ncbi:hypothetical protein AGMMS49525_11600 [Bacteroidia bacterium]|nr:hypothetical protein AGMMS49525_11600 [Bacteroidia bacterium]
MNKNKFYIKIFGEKMLEAYFADALLKAYYDGEPRPDYKSISGNMVWVESRIIQLLLDNNFLKPFDNGYIITSTGRMHLDKGGYVGEYISAKTNRLAFWLGVFATAISIFAFVRTL